MPYIRIETNQSVTDSKTTLKKLSAAAAAAIGKPESYVQTSLDPGREMTFGGSDEPTAFIQCKSIGLPQSKTTEISASLCAFCASELSIPEERVYIEFADAAGRMWGWNGGTF